MLKELTNPILWKNMHTSEAHRPFIEDALARFEQYEKEPILADNFHDFDLFRTTGNRRIFEIRYFDKRTRLVISAVLTLLYPEEEKYLAMLEDTIWAICDEYTWSLPAHISWAKDERTDIDLFASETGCALSEIITLLKDRLNARIYKRVCEEIERRILTSYENNNYDWEKSKHNWSAVCAGSLGITFIHMAPDRFEKVKSRLHDSLECFLSGYTDDGICFEGLGYWEYGFGFFVAYAQRLYEHTNGKENFFAREKVHSIARFQEMTDLGGVDLSFSDVIVGEQISSPAIYGVLQMHYPDIRIPRAETYFILDHCGRWCRYFDAFAYMPQPTGAQATDFERFSASAGWYLKRNASYGFAIKAGTNDEPHNHNDVGSFIFAAKGKRLLCDLGAGEYVSGYFDNQTRYNYLCNSSRGHSVPIIDGKYQSPGAQYKGTMTLNNGIVQIDFSDAYDTDVHTLRTLSFGPNSVTLSDTFEKPSGKTQITERFVTTTKPLITEGAILIEDLKLTASEGWEVSIQQTTFTEHFGNTVDVYLIDYTTAPAEKLTFTLNMETK